jgi:hypothetical protein
MHRAAVGGLLLLGCSTPSSPTPPASNAPIDPGTPTTNVPLYEYRVLDSATVLGGFDDQGDPARAVRVYLRLPPDQPRVTVLSVAFQADDMSRVSECGAPPLELAPGTAVAIGPRPSSSMGSFGYRLPPNGIRVKVSLLLRNAAGALRRTELSTITSGSMNAPITPILTPEWVCS